MSERQANEIAPTLDLGIKIAVSLNRQTQVATGMAFVNSTQPHIEARIPFRYDLFGDTLTVPEDVNQGAWRSMVKAMIRFHAHVYQTATDNLVERTNQLLNEAKYGPDLPPMPGPGNEQAH